MPTHWEESQYPGGPGGPRTPAYPGRPGGPRGPTAPGGPEEPVLPSPGGPGYQTYSTLDPDRSWLSNFLGMKSSPAGPRGPFCPTPDSPRSPFSPGGPGGHISLIITLPAGGHMLVVALGCSLVFWNHVTAQSQWIQILVSRMSCGMSQVRWQAGEVRNYLTGGIITLSRVCERRREGDFCPTSVSLLSR